jgi:hypothetical protein
MFFVLGCLIYHFCFIALALAEVDSFLFMFLVVSYTLYDITVLSGK